MAGENLTRDDPTRDPVLAVEEHMLQAICTALVSACLATDPGETHHTERERTARLFQRLDIWAKVQIDGGVFSLKLDTTHGH